VTFQISISSLLGVFTSIDASWPGSVHDCRVLKNSPIFPILQQIGNHGFLLGDMGYGIAPYLMTPYENPVTDNQKRFNRQHTSNRVIIEQTFGQLKRRFPFLKYCVRVKLERIPSYICACFVLDNVAKFLKDPDFEEYNEEEEEEIIPFEGQVNEHQVRNQGKQRRDEISMHLND
jgi:hypothetical protein